MGRVCSQFLSKVLVFVVAVQLGFLPQGRLPLAMADAGGPAPKDGSLEVSVETTAKSPSPLDLLAQLRSETTLHPLAKKQFAMKQTIVTFPAEAMTFYGAIFMTSMMDYYATGLTKSGKIDPMPVQTMVNLLTDPIGYVGFLAFVMAAHKTTLLVTQWDLLIKRAEGIIELQNKFPNTNFGKFSRSEAIGKTILKTPALKQMAKGLQFMGGHSGFAMGMIASHMVEDYVRGFRADPDVKSCTQGIRQEVDKSKHQLYQDACERAFDSWVRLDKKILKMAPSLASGFLTIAIKSVMRDKAMRLINYGVKKGFEKKGITKIAIRGFRIAFNVAPVPHFKGAQIAVKLIDLGMFLTIQMKLSDKVVKTAWTIPEQGHALAKSRKELYDQVATLGEKNQWKNPEGWKGETANGNLDLMSQLNMLNEDRDALSAKLSIKQTAKQIIQDQLGFKKDAGQEFLEKLMIHQRRWQEWRYLLLEELLIAHANWESYTGNFLNATQMTHIYYNALAMSHKAEDLLKVDYFKGVLPDKDSDEGLPLKERQKVTLLKVSHRIQESLKDGTLWSGDIRESLIKIVDYFRAADSAQPSSKVLLENHLLDLQKSGLNSDELKRLEEDYRDQTMAYGLRIAEDLLYNFNPKKSPGGIPKYIESKLPAKRFLQDLRELLGHPQPRFYKGQTYLQAMENIIFPSGGEGAQDVDIRHPKKIGKVATRRFADYLLASALCGPDLSSPGAQLIVEGDPELEKTVSDLSDDGKLREGQLEKTVKSESPAEVTTPMVYRTLMGWGEVRFVPPRIVENIDFSPCEMAPSGSKSTDLLNLGFKDPKSRGSNIHSGQWTYGTQTFDGFLDILMAHISSELLVEAKENEESGFDRWWNRNVAPTVIAKMTHFRQEFQKILDHHYWPKINSEKGSWVGDTPMGISNTMSYEASQYLWILQSVYRSALLKEGSYDASSDKRYKEYTKLSEDLVKGFKQALEPKASVESIKGLTQNLKNLETLLQKEFNLSAVETMAQLPQDFRSQVAVALLQALSKQSEELNFYLMVAQAFSENHSTQ